MIREAGAGSGVVLTLWRAAAGFRIVTLGLCLYLIVRWQPLYAHPGVATSAGVAMVAVTAAVVLAAIQPGRGRPALVAVDVLASGGLTLLSRAAQHPHQFHGGMPTLTSVWAAGPTIEAGLLLGVAGGAGAAIVQFAVTVVVRAGWGGQTLLNGLLLLVVGVVAGYLATVGARAEQHRAESAAEAARLAEREELARSIHDGVLQVLGLVHRRGLEAGGEWAALAREAATQEAALRALIASRLVPAGAARSRSVTADLVLLRSDRVTVSVPNTAVDVAPGVAAPVLAAVRAALANVEQHAGQEARAWVLLEDLGEEIAVSVRDDGAGMATGRLDAAAAEGRLGVAQSIRGRIRDLGGRVEIRSAPGEGTEVEIVVPRADREVAR